MSIVLTEWVPDPVVLGRSMLAVADSLSDATLPLAKAAQVYREDIDDRFATETDPDGAPWQYWAESYVEYAENFPNTGILDQTSELREAATSGRATIISNDTLFYDTTVLPERGIWHQEGRPNRMTRGGKPNPLPQRRFLGLSAEAEALITLSFVDWFNDAIALYPTSTGLIGRRHSLRGAGGRFVPRESIGLGAMT